MTLFGTDGVRAPFGEPPLDRATVTALAAHLGRRLAAARPGSRVVLGGDTRDSTPILWRWLAAGLRFGGAEPLCAGVVPTPAVAWLTRDLGAACGISVSASHNPHPDNGVKLLDGDSGKWSAQEERELAGRLTAEPGFGAGADGPPVEVDPRLGARYVAALAATAPPAALAGLRLVIDAAHGAAAPWAGSLFRGLGAEVTLLGASPDGRNINLDCGSTHPAAMARQVAALGADLGLAFDGDADRVILADERGEVRDGDAILYLWARALHRRGELAPPRIVATSMSNLGLERALAEDDIGVERCDVGDRAVVETLRRLGLRLGGEQSGHVVDLRRSATGDGLRTALEMALLRAGSQLPLSAMLRGLRRYPQLLRNVRVARKQELSRLPRVRSGAARGRRAPRPERPPGAALQRHRAPAAHHARGSGPGIDRSPGRRARAGDSPRPRARRPGRGVKGKRMLHLSVNVDHVATLRQARRTTYPDPVEAARLAEQAGATGITVHLRGDRRHIQDRDVERLRETVRGKLNLEMAATDEMCRLAAALRPDQVSLVPESPHELTTEGGLDLRANGPRLREAGERLRGAGIAVSAFVDPDPQQIEALAAMPPGLFSGFEINTDAYTRAAEAAAATHELARAAAVATLGPRYGLRVYAGHGLTSQNVGPIAALPQVEELNIGHAIVSRAVLVGMTTAVAEMLAALRAARS